MFDGEHGSFFFTYLVETGLFFLLFCSFSHALLNAFETAASASKLLCVAVSTSSLHCLQPA